MIFFSRKHAGAHNTKLSTLQINSITVIMVVLLMIAVADAFTIY